MNTRTHIIVHILLVILMTKKLLESFTKNIRKKETNQKEFRIEKVIKNKCDNYILNGKQLEKQKRHSVNE